MCRHAHATRQLLAPDGRALLEQPLEEGDDQGVGLSLPEGVACGASGDVVVGDTGNDRLVRFSYQDKIVVGGSPIQIPELSAPFRVQLS